ncbi:hypothetical protein F5Y05DRAFT_416334 [Hypoxylon sp. FL0543]|nr:hypothetical protein F5Y05DRAFT_416334 [Hypoxylon sp. FL0543]
METSSSSTNFLTNSSTSIGTKSTSTPVIQYNYRWFITLSIASVVLTLATLGSLVCPILLFFTTAPDLMLNISSLAIGDNPANGSFVAASDRARLLKDLKVQFGDGDSASEGRILAIASLDSPGVRDVGNMRKLRLYW